MHANLAVSLSLVSLLFLSSCAEHKNLTEPAIQIKDIDIPFYSRASAPIELKRNAILGPDLPQFVPPATRGVSSCLIPVQEQKLRKLLDGRETLLDGWEVYGFSK